MDWRGTLREEQERPVPLDRLGVALGTVWPAVRVTGATMLTGGLSSVLHRVELSGAPVNTVVLRRLLPAFGDDAATVRREVAVHAVASDLAVPVPRVHWSDPEGSVLGGPALVIDDVPGRLLLGDLTQPAALEAFADAIHAVHAVPVTAVPSLTVLEDVTAHADRFGPPGEGAPAALARRIEAAIDDGRRWFRPERVLVHMDLHAGNVLWDGTVVTGVLDWPGAAVGVGAAEEAYAWLDASLAHGRAVGDRLQAELDMRRPSSAPTAGEVTLWRACALRRALPTPAPWAEVYRAAGVDVTDEQVERRFHELVEGLGED